MRKGTKKITANSENLAVLQTLRNSIKEFQAQNVKWGGRWNGINWESFSFYATEGELCKIKSYCLKAELQIDFS
jgi:hypothetical protein